MILERLIVKIDADLGGLEKATPAVKGLERGFNQSMGSMTGGLDRFHAQLTKSRPAFGLFAGAAGAGLASKAVFDLGAAVGETASKFKTVFGPETDRVSGFIREFGVMAGLSSREAQELLATTGAIGQGMGLSGRAAANFSIDLTRLAGDLSSFNNIPIAETSQAIQAAVTGEREQLKRYGIVISEADVTKRALLDTGKRTAAQLTQEEKAYATLALVTQRAGVAVGDLARTKESAANQARALRAEIQNIKEAIAVSLLPAMGAGVQGLNAFIKGLQIMGAEAAVSVAKIELAFAKLHEGKGGPLVDFLGLGEGAGLMDPLGLDLFSKAAGVDLTLSVDQAEANLERISAAADQVKLDVVGLARGLAGLTGGLDASGSAASAAAGALGALTIDPKGLALSADNLGRLVDLEDELQKQLKDLRFDLAFEPGVTEARKLQEELQGVVEMLDVVRSGIARQTLAGVGITPPVAMGVTRTHRGLPGGKLEVAEVPNWLKKTMLEGIKITMPPKVEALTKSGSWGGLWDGLKKGVKGEWGDLKGLFDPKTIMDEALGGLLSGGLSSVLGLGGKLLGNLFGGGDVSPAQEALTAAMEKNREALDRVSQGLVNLKPSSVTLPFGDVGLAIQEALSIADATRGTFDQAGERLDVGGYDAFVDALSKYGVTLTEAEEIAKSLGLEWISTEGFVRAFGEALKDVSTFSRDFGLLQTQFDLFDTTDPLAKFNGAMDLLATSVGPEFAEVLRGLTPENFDAFLEMFRSGFGGFDKSLLGNLPFEEFLQGLGFVEGALDELGNATNKATNAMRNLPAGFKVDLARYRATEALVSTAMTVSTSTSGSRGGGFTVASQGAAAAAAGGTVVNVEEIHVHGVQDPRAFLEQMEAEVQWKIRKGAGSVVNVRTVR